MASRRQVQSFGAELIGGHKDAAVEVRPKSACRLACGKIRNETDRAAILAHFAKQAWDLWDEPWLRERLLLMAQQGYENHGYAVVAKLLLRRKVE